MMAFWPDSTARSLATNCRNIRVSVWRCINVGSDAGVGDGEGGEKVVQTVGVGVKRWIQLHANCLVHGLRKHFLAEVHKGARDVILCPNCRLDNRAHAVVQINYQY